MTDDHPVADRGRGVGVKVTASTVVKERSHPSSSAPRLLQRAGIGVGERLAIHLQIRCLFVFQRVSGQRKGDTKRLRAVLLEHELGFGHALACLLYTSDAADE